MRKILAILVALAAMLAGGVALNPSPSSANPGSPQCITKAEWKRLEEGMTRNKVKRITGIWGKTYDSYDYRSGAREISVKYRQCLGNGKPSRGWDFVFVAYSNVRVWNWNGDPTLYPNMRLYDIHGWSRP
jgi:hypothetical protein